MPVASLWKRNGTTTVKYRFVCITLAIRPRRAINMLRSYKLVLSIIAVGLFEVSVVPCVLSQGKIAEPPSGEPHIKVQSVNVVIDLIVTDRHGHHVPGLTASDFTIYEDGVPQKIVGFTPSAGSASNTSSPAAAPKADE